MSANNRNEEASRKGAEAQKTERARCFYCGEMVEFHFTPANVMVVDEECCCLREETPGGRCSVSKLPEAGK